MPTIYEQAEAFRAALLRQERAAASAMLEAYGQVWQNIQAELMRLTRQIEMARANGEVVNATWLLKQRDFLALQRQIEVELGKFIVFADARIRAEQARAVADALSHAEQLVLAGLVEAPISIHLLPREAFTNLVGFLHDGSPLRDLLDQLGPEASTAARNALLTGLATGQGPRVIARLMREALGGNLARALTIARTETLRAYREASLQTYRANRDVVKGWIWLSAASRRTCACCWAMHGTFHRLDERLDGHPNCRCSMLPVTRSAKELGLSAEFPQPQIEPGAARFARLPEAEQRKVLGAAKFRAYQAGQITLQDLVGRRRSERWGTMRYERSLRAALAAKQTL